MAATARGRHGRKPHAGADEAARIPIVPVVRPEHFEVRRVSTNGAACGNSRKTGCKFLAR